jgi:hypothetical protein
LTLSRVSSARFAAMQLEPNHRVSGGGEQWLRWSFDHS